VAPDSIEVEFQFGVTEIATVQVRIEFWLQMLPAPFTVIVSWSEFTKVLGSILAPSDTVQYSGS
jgi:hypothetical protein